MELANFFIFLCTAPFISTCTTHFSPVNICHLKRMLSAISVGNYNILFRLFVSKNSKKMNFFLYFVRKLLQNSHLYTSHAWAYSDIRRGSLGKGATRDLFCVVRPTL